VTLTRRRADPVAVALSLALHGLLVVAAVLAPPPPGRRADPVDVEIVETVRPVPPAAEPPPPAAPPEPPPPPPRRVLRAPVESRRVVPQVAPAPAPPPPSDAAEDAPPPEDEPPRVGVTMSGGTTGVAAPSGNTMYGRMPERAPDPAQVRPYRAEDAAPPPVVTSLPQVIDDRIPPEEYPPQARREGREGVVKLRLVVGVDGRVHDVRVVSDPGFGFGEVAVRRARLFRFRPARIGDEPVATEIPYSVTFVLP
jgi:protein TonB